MAVISSFIFQTREIEKDFLRQFESRGFRTTSGISTHSERWHATAQLRR